MIDINQRYEALCMELGHLTLELGAREQRRDAIVEEMQVLRRLAASMHGGQHVPVGTKSDAVTPVAATPARPNGASHAADASSIEEILDTR